MNRSLRARITAAVSLALAVAGCSGGGNGAPVMPGHSASAGKGTGTAVFVIKVPSQSSTSSSGAAGSTSALRASAHHDHLDGVQPQYVSPATQSITVDITGPTNVNETANLTINSSGCTSTLANTVCTLTVPGLLPGSYTATLTTYDQTGGTGNVLSAAQAVAFTIVAGQSNQIALTLSGVPVTTLVLPADSATLANASGGYDILGQGAHKFVAESLDADGNIIVGPGSPLFTIGTPSGIAGMSTSPSTTTTSAPNAFTVTPPAAFVSGTASFTVTPTFAGQATDGCTQTGANCTPATVSVGMVPFVSIPSASCCVLADDPTIDRVYEGSGSQTSVVDGSTFTVVTTISGGGGANNVDSTNDNLWLPGLYAGNAKVYSGNTDSLLATVSLADCPVSTWVDSTKRYVWVAAQCGGGNDPVWAVSADTFAVVDGPIGTGGVMGPTVVNTATGKLYVNNSAGNFEVNPSTFALTSTAFGTVIAADASANVLYGRITDGLNIIAGGTTNGSETITSTLSLPYTPSTAAVGTSLNHLYLSGGSGAFIDVYDATTGAFVRTIELPSGMTVLTLGADSTRDLIYAAVSSGGTDYLYALTD